MSTCINEDEDKLLRYLAEINFNIYEYHICTATYEMIIDINYYDIKIKGIEISYDGDFIIEYPKYTNMINFIETTTFEFDDYIKWKYIREGIKRELNQQEWIKKFFKH